MVPLSGPVEAFDTKNQMPPLIQAIQQSNFADAAARLDAIFHDSPDALVSSNGGSLVSVRAWAESLPAANRLAIQPEYDKIVGDIAKQAVETVSATPGNRPEDFVAIANAYPFSAAAGEAWGRAALRAIEFGDGAVVPVLRQRAVDCGWKPTDAQQKLLDTAAKLPVGSAVTVPFIAPWYPLIPPIAYKRVIPVAAGGSVFISTDRGIVACKETGELLWQWVAPKTEVVISGARLGFQQPAVLCDAAGKPQVVVARQIIGGMRFGCLRAFRASDGKPLWTTESLSTLGSWSLASAPALGGRTVVVVAVDETARPAPLAVMAFDTMTGRQLWQTPLGAFNSLTEVREPGAFREVDALWSNSAPTIDGPDIFVNAGTGLTACLDRFDGKIRWVRSYVPVPSPGDELLDLARKNSQGHNDAGTKDLYKQRLAVLKQIAGKGLTEFAPGDRHDKHEVSPEIAALAAYFSQPPRWLSTPAVADNVVVIAAADMASAVGLDRHDGSQLWEISDDLRSATLLGASSGAAVFASTTLTAIDARTSKNRWTWTAPDSQTLSGPASISPRGVRVAAGKIQSLSPDSGRPNPLTPAGTALTPILANEASRNALTSIDGLTSLSAPVSRPAPPPAKR